MKFTCPFCYNQHSTDQCPLSCSYPHACPKGVNRTNGVFIDKKDYGKCLKCTMAVKRFYCPTLDGPLAIPQRCIVAGSLPIALVGAKATGKSNYIGVLVNEIKKKMSRNFGCAINMNCDPATRSNYENMYYRPLYKESMQIGATDAGEIPPMIFPIDFPSGKQVTLTFYDTAGENLDNEQMMQENNGYLPHSKGIIMLLDPLQVPEIREKLEGRIPLPVQNTEAFNVLDIVVQNIEHVTNNYNVKKPFDMPIAVVFTKIDALEPFEELLPADSCLRYDSEHVDRGMFITDDFESTQLEMQRILGNLLDNGTSEFATKMRRFKNSAFFGLTALGSMPDANGYINGGVKPRRVLDPLLWLLAENKYIKKVKK